MPEFIPAITVEKYDDALVSAFVRVRARGTALCPPVDLDPNDEQVRQTARLFGVLCQKLGSGLIDQSQKMTAAAMQMAEKKVWAHRS